jgi:predicted dehydrogenase
VDIVVVDPAQGLDGDLSGIDAAIVATPTSTHARVALPLLERGVPCLVEKPLASTLDEARALAVHPHLSVGHVERFNPVFSVVRGAPRFVQAERVGRWTPRGADVDVVLDLMIHDLDLFLHFAGEDVRDVRANGVAVATGGFDLAHARVETVGGRVGTFTASRLARQAARRWRLFTDDGYWSLDLKDRAAARVAWAGGGVAEVREGVPDRDPLGSEVAAFVAAVRGDAPFRVPGSDGLRALELAEAVRAAIRPADG